MQAKRKISYSPTWIWTGAPIRDISEGTNVVYSIEGNARKIKTSPYTNSLSFQRGQRSNYQIFQKIVMLLIKWKVIKSGIT